MLFGKYINRYYLKYAPRLILGVAALLLVDYFQMVTPQLYRMVVNGINDGVVEYHGEVLPFDMTFLLDHICLPLLGVILVMVLGRFFWRVCLLGAGIRVETDLRARMFDRCKDLSQPFYQVHKVGDMMALFTNDLETVQDCFGFGVLMVFDTVILSVLAIFRMSGMSLLLTGFSLIPMAFLLVIGAIVERSLTKKWEARQEAFSELSGFSQENFLGIAVIKAFVKETKEIIAFRHLNKKNEKANVEYTKTSMLLEVMVSLFVGSVVCVILGVGGYLVHEGVFDPGQLVEFIGYFTTIVWPVMAVAELISMRSRGKASLSRIGELLDAEPEVVDRDGVEDVEMLSGDIECRGLAFCYPGAEHEALREVTFRILPGEHVGLIGKTGSGKTTLVDLLLRTYNVPDGTVFLDGKDINGLSIRTVRENMAYVPQDNFLFSDSIEHNIAFAAETLDEDAVEVAARLSDVHDNIVEFTDGYHTVLGERGVTISGGQKQRISIARALMKNAPILILDDSVSAVDISTEKVILENLRRVRAGKTTILIAHRISTVETMDKLILLDGGHVVAVGSHEELYKTVPMYHDMVESQRLEEENERGGERNV